MGLLDRLRGRNLEPPKPALAPGTRLYCIGDIHGRADLLRQLHEKIREDTAGFAGEKSVVYLGDYVDRGEESREVIEILLSDSLPGFKAIHLRGNHEQAMLDFLAYPEKAAGWLSYGGLTTLLSYGVRLDRPPYAADAALISTLLDEKLPDEHRAFLEQLDLSYQEGSYCFVHAGIRPGIDLDRQHPDDLLWIRDEFIEHKGPHEFIVVHGHSITEEAELLANRIGLDTGAFSSDVLTCLVLEGSEQRLIQTSP